ncbi:hypothetical protein VTN77DRAFT_9375 [Rasamsonia byssochlamydoides]|uniref:uncharacterized protein n=1 Tax=Rasamsonia byssochlamydoides TaxID=89139 RepID=UPI003743325C
MVSNTAVPDRGPQLIAILWVLTGASTVTVIFRFIARAQKAVMGWDDVFMLVALLCFYGWSICLTILSAKGGERHIQDVVALGPDVVAEVQLLNWTSQVFGIFGVGAGKVSVSALLLAILRNTWRAWQVIYLWIVCIGLVLCVSTSCSILTFAQCRPAAALWDARIKGECIDPKIMADFGTFTGAYNTFVDASLALIPSTIFWSLQMSTQEKAQLSIVFALNILTSICSGIKTSYLSQLANRKDFTWATYDIFVWVTAEFFLIIFCGTLPTLKPILNFVRRHLLRLPSRKYSGRSYQRHTGDEEIQLSSMRPDGTSSHTMVSAFEEDPGLKDAGNNQITVEKTYEVHIR